MQLLVVVRQPLSANRISIAAFSEPGRDPVTVRDLARDSFYEPLGGEHRALLLHSFTAVEVPVEVAQVEIRMLVICRDVAARRARCSIASISGDSL